MGDMNDLTWPASDYSRVPYLVFNDPDVYAREQERIFQGPVWCYLALEAELPKPGDFRSTYVGETPVVVSRATDGTLHAFVNRCAHRGTMVVRKLRGNATDHTCIYHHWCYDLTGKLIGVPFQRGVAGKGGMPENFRKEDHGLRTLKVASYRGAIFGSFRDDVEPLEDFLDEANRDYLDLLLGKPIEILGYWRQRIPGNWKFYFENLMDSYHAGLLHQFQTTFGIMRTTQKGESLMDKWRRHRVVYTQFGSDDAASDGNQDLKDLGVFHESMSLADPSLLEFRDETGDGRAIMMMALFPSVLFQRLSNTLATRQIRPRGPNEFELYWTCFGYADDDAALRALRLKQVNLIGPAGYVSIEDGEAGALIQRVLGREKERHSVIEMGGTGAIENQDTPLTEVPVRGFWRFYCHLMGFPAQDGSVWRPA